MSNLETNYDCRISKEYFENIGREIVGVERKFGFFFLNIRSNPNITNLI